MVAGCLMAAMLAHGQAPAGQNAPARDAQKQTAVPQKQTGAPQKQEANPFPEDTTTVPVMPNSGTAPVPEGTYSGGNGMAALPGDEKDPVRSPDDVPAGDDSAQEATSSSSLSGLDKLIPSAADDDEHGKHKKLVAPGHQETSKEDVDVGKYYLEIKNWKAAMSRFQSAMVLAPDDPEVYWGLAEADHHLGKLAEAKANYQKVVDYDPDGPHGKAARKALKDPEIANAKAAAPGTALTVGTGAGEPGK